MVSKDLDNTSQCDCLRHRKGRRESKDDSYDRTRSEQGAVTVDENCSSAGQVKCQGANFRRRNLRQGRTRSFHGLCSGDKPAGQRVWPALERGLQDRAARHSVIRYESNAKGATSRPLLYSSASAPRAMAMLIVHCFSKQF